MQDKLLNYSALSSSVVGVEYEFYSFKSPNIRAKEVAKILGKKVLISRASGNVKDSKSAKYTDDDLVAKVTTTGANDKNKSVSNVSNVFTPELLSDKEKAKKSKSEFVPTASTLVLKRDYSGGRDMNELVTGPLPYEEARLTIIKILDWIRLNGWTDKRCSMHLNISFNPFLSKLKNGVSHLEPLKMILSYDEKYIYDRFPNRKNNVYAKSVYQILPVNKFVFQSTADNLDPANFIVPDEKYYGLNFTKRVHNYLEVRYVGGKDYEKKVNKILEVLDYSILKIYNALLNPGIDLTEAEKLRGMMTNMRKITESFSSPQRFFIDYPAINVLIDMKGNIEIVKSYWTSLREQLFSLIISAGATEGVFNYDTDMSKPQFRFGKLKNVHELRNFEIFDSEFEGSAYDCLFFRCKLQNSRIDNCSLVEFNTVEDSTLEYSSSLGTNTLVNCYINCPDSIIEGSINGGVIRNAILGVRADLTSDVMIVNQK